jgi:ketosteroid isomerase-like protein
VSQEISPSADLAFFQQLEDRFNRAMVSNDIHQIGECISDDWVLVTPESGPVSRAAILHVIQSGVLAHSSMEKKIARAMVYADIAVITGRGQNTGTFKGAPIQADEWVTDIYRNSGGHWRCVLTQLTPVATSGQLAKK